MPIGPVIGGQRDATASQPHQQRRMEMDTNQDRDYTECPGGNCGAEVGPYGMTYSHVHCAIDGCVMHAEGGGGDDGTGIGGYDNAMRDPDLGELVSIDCRRRKINEFAVGQKVLVGAGKAPAVIVALKYDHTTDIVNDIKVRFEGGRELWFPPTTQRFARA